MLNRIAVVVFLFACIVPVYAQKKVTVDVPPTVKQVHTVNNTNGGEHQTQTANGGASNQTQSQVGGANTQSQTSNGGASNQTQSANNAGNAQNVNYHTPRQAPFAYAAEAYPSAPCRVSGSAGVSAPVGGLSFGGSKLDDQCDKRETARAFSELIGDRNSARSILCTTKAAHDAKLESCGYAPPDTSSVDEDSIQY